MAIHIWLYVQCTVAGAVAGAKIRDKGGAAAENKKVRLRNTRPFFLYRDNNKLLTFFCWHCENNIKFTMNNNIVMTITNSFKSSCSFYVKGTVQTRFSTSSFFHHSNQPGPLTNGLKYFRFWLSFCRVIWIFLNLPGVWYCAESISPGYHTPESQMTFLDSI